jgi:hypothetical protein
MYLSTALAGTMLRARHALRPRLHRHFPATFTSDDSRLCAFAPLR